MSKPTEQLRKAREAAGLTLEDVQDRTKIQTKYLKAVEEGQFSDLPGKFYTRAFIRTYASYLGVDPSPILDYFEKTVTPEQKEPEPLQSSPSNFPSMSRSQRYAKKHRKTSWRSLTPRSLGLKWYAWVLLILFMLLIPAVIYYFNAFGEGTDTSDKNTDGDSVKAESVTEKGNGGKEADVQLVKPSETHKYGDVYQIEGAGDVEVTIEARDTTWFRYRAGGPTKEITMEKTLNAGESQKLKHPEWISLMIGKPNQVKLTVNGNVIDTSDEATPHTYQLKLAK